MICISGNLYNYAEDTDADRLSKAGYAEKGLS
jgi:hypothetical protein